MSRITAIASIAPQLNEAGRIRAGIKKTIVVRSGPNKGKERTVPAAIQQFRFTSQDRELIDAIAGTYGGTVEAWDEPKAPGIQWQVITEANKIDVLLPPDPLDGPVFELWDGGGRKRRCDLENCEVEVDSPNGPEYQWQQGCLCDGEYGEPWPDDPLLKPRQCKLKMRLQVILPQFALAGAWRIDTGGVLAARKLPAMIQLIQTLQAGGLPAGYLFLQQSKSRGGRREYTEILLGLKASPDQLTAQLGTGSGTAVAIGSSGQPALEAGEPTDTGGDYHDDDDEPVDGEIVDDDESTVDYRYLVAQGAAKGLREATLLRQVMTIKNARGATWEIEQLRDVAGCPAAAHALLDWIEFQ